LKSSLKPIQLSVIVIAGIVAIITNFIPDVHATCITGPSGATICAGMSQSINMTRPNTNEFVAHGENPDVVITLDCEMNGIRYGDYYNTCYQPPILYVTPGSIVTWKNDDTVQHSVTYGNRWDALSSGYFFDSQSIEPGQSFSYQFRYQGAYPYYDAFNWWETGLVVVKR
jgi:hypothetical protein